MMFNGKVVLITGAASGIGATTATHFAKNGASLALTDRNMPNLEKVGADCKKTSSLDPFLVKADLTNEADVVNLVESVIANYNHLDVLVNCAGVVECDTIETASLAQFDNVFNTNVRAVYHLTMLAVPHLIPAKGCIVNVSSTSSIRTYPFVLAYSMSKSAVDRFTKCLARELGPKGVRVNSVNPSAIKTPLWETVALDDKTLNMMIEKEVSENPLERLGTAEEVAKSIAFLASEDATFTNGVNLLVDGGRCA